MNLKKTALTLCLTFSLLLTITGCSSNNSTTNKEGVDVPSTNSQKVEEQNANSDNKENKDTVVKFTIYQGDLDTYEAKIAKEVEIKDNLSIEDKLKEIAKNLSETVFNKRTIEVKGIEEVEGKKIATINLVDTDSDKWYDSFQGSTGGTLTTIALSSSFIQPDYKGEWIDGVTFLNNGEKISQQHAPALENTIFRANFDKNSYKSSSN